VVEWLREHTDLPEDAVLSPEEAAKNEPYLRKLARAIPVRIRLEDVTPEERLAGLAPEEIARALSEADRVLALPDAALRALPDDYLATLPDDARRRIRERLAR